MTCTHARFRDASSPIPLTPRATDIAPAEVNPLDLDGHNRFSAFAAASAPCIPDAIMASISRSDGPSPKAWSHSLRDRHAGLRERFTVFPWSRTCSRGMMHSLYECLRTRHAGQGPPWTARASGYLRYRTCRRVSRGSASPKAAPPSAPSRLLLHVRDPSPQWPKLIILTFLELL
jgi:hypothetical protein